MAKGSLLASLPDCLTPPPFRLEPPLAFIDSIKEMLIHCLSAKNNAWCVGYVLSLRSAYMKPKWVALVIVVMSIAGCTTVQISQDYDPEKNFVEYQTWQWQLPEQPPSGDIRIDNPLLDRRIRKAVENHLADRHLNPTDISPDLLLSYNLGIERKIYSDDYYSYMGMGYYGHPWYIGAGLETRIYQYDQSRLIIDIHDAQTRELLWRGEGVYLLTTFKTPQDAAEAMQRTVDKILSQFPPDP
jgi:hypothetical protein